MRENLAAKLEDPQFRQGIDPLLANRPPDYDINTTADLVMGELGSRLRNAPPAKTIEPLLPR